jgi:hypothetical protein
MSRGKPIFCECGHARSHHCRKISHSTSKPWWGACYHGYPGPMCKCLRTVLSQKPHML